FDNFGTYQISVRAIAEQATSYRNSLWSDAFTLTFTTFNYVGVVTLETTYMELAVGQTFDLNAQTLPETNQTLNYQSSNQQIVSVSNGLITANALGTSTISVSTRRYHTAYIEVTVYPNIQNESGNQINIEIGDLH